MERIENEIVAQGSVAPFDESEPESEIRLLKTLSGGDIVAFNEKYGMVVIFTPKAANGKVAWYCSGTHSSIYPRWCTTGLIENEPKG